MKNDKMPPRKHIHPMLKKYLVIISFFYVFAFLTSSSAHAKSYVVDEDQVRSEPQRLSDGIIPRRGDGVFDHFAVVVKGGNCEIPRSSVTGYARGKSGVTFDLNNGQWHITRVPGEFRIEIDGFPKDTRYYQIQYVVSCGPGTRVAPEATISYHVDGKENETISVLKSLIDRTEVVELANLTELNVRPEQCLYLPLFIQKTDNVLVKVKKPLTLKTGLLM